MTPEETRSQTWNPRRRALVAVQVCSTVVGMWLVMVAVPLLEVEGVWLGAAMEMVGAVLIAALSLHLILQLVRLPLAPLYEMITAVGLVWIWVGLATTTSEAGPVRLWLLPITTAAMVALMAFVGRIIARMFREKNILLPVALVVIVVDVFTVFQGPVAMLMEKVPEALPAASINVPAPGSAAEDPAQLQALAYLGIGDLIFLGVFLTAAWKFGLDMTRGVRIMGAFLLAGVMVGLLAPVPVPLLLFVAPGFLLAYRGEFKLSRQEAVATAVGMVVVVGLLALLSWGMGAVLGGAGG